jgi:CRP/FNR family transcriptional regulator
MLVDLPYQAKSVTSESAAGLALPRAQFVQLVEGSPLFATFLFRSFSTRFAGLLALLDAVSFNRLDERLASLLLLKGDWIRATHSQIADELGTVREVISRILKDFERHGWVKLERGVIQLTNRLALEQLSAIDGNQATPRNEKS